MGKYDSRLHFIYHGVLSEDKTKFKQQGAKFH